MLSRDGRLRLFGHPIHPMLTDLPIGLWSLTLLWDLVALWRGDFWWEVSFWTLLAGTALAAPTAVTGFIDSRSFEPRSASAATASTHLLLMVSATTSFVVSLIVRGGTDLLTGIQAALAFGLVALGVLLMGAGAWFGGELVFRHGSGVAQQDNVDQTG